MRVLIVSQYFWPEQFRINDLAEGLVERGHEVTVLTGCPNYPGGKVFKGYGFFNGTETHHGVRIHRVPLIPRGPGSGFRLGLNYLSFMISATVLGPLLCRGSFDLVFVCQLSPVTVGIPGAFLRWLKHAPMVFWVLDLWPESVATVTGTRASWEYKCLDAVVKFIYRRCDRILYSSRGFSTSILSRGGAASRLSYFPNWVEPVRVPACAPPVRLPEGFRIVFAGNVGEAQDFGTILAAAERLKDMPAIQWIILGEGRQWNWVKDQVEARALSHCFHLLGRFPADTMPSFFQQADALLVTLKRDATFALTVPGKVPACMSCGRPILAALDGEGADLIREAEAGFVVPAGDHLGLADRVLTLMDLSSEKRSRIGQKAKRFSDSHFDRDRLFTELEAMFHHLTGLRT